MAEEVEESSKIRVFYQNAPFHRTVFVGGVWAGISPAGLIQLGLFNDLRPMPEMEVREVIGDSVGREVEKAEKRGVIREVETTLVMPLGTAKALLPLIQQMIDQLEAIQKAQTEKAENGDNVS